MAHRRSGLAALGLAFFGLLLCTVGGCGKGSSSSETSGTPTTNPGYGPMVLTLDWKPEPEFGGFYAAQKGGEFARLGLDVAIKPAGEGAPTWQLVATGKTEFATTAADQVLVARRKDADVVAIFAVYQTFPQGVMVHKARGFTTLKDVFTHDGEFAVEDNPWVAFLKNKFGPGPVKLIAYSGGVSDFLAKPNFSQQCFVTSEPLLAKQKGGDPQTFLIADEGFNPYTTVVICKGELLRANPDRVKAMAVACRAGWRAYLDNPADTNSAMHALNPEMDLATFTAAAEAQKPLIETDATKTAGLGSMTADRWDSLARQLVDLKVIDQPVKATDCFVNP